METLLMITYTLNWNVTDGTLSTKLYDKRDDFDFRVVNFPYICSNIPESPAYSVYISQFIRYARACSSCGDFVDRGSYTLRKIEDLLSKVL